MEHQIVTFLMQLIQIYNIHKYKSISVLLMQTIEMQKKVYASNRKQYKNS